MRERRLSSEERMRQSEDALDRVLDGSPRSDSCVAQTTTIDAYPTSPNAFYAVQRLEVGGEEVEGGAATTSPASDGTFFAWNRGTAVPPEGTTLIADEVGGRWTIEYNG